MCKIVHKNLSASSIVHKHLRDETLTITCHGLSFYSFMNICTVSSFFQSVACDC